MIVHLNQVSLLLTFHSKVESSRIPGKKNFVMLSAPEDVGKKPKFSILDSFFVGF